MLQKVKQFFEDRIGPDVNSGQEQDHEHAIRLATAALLIEVSRADTEISEIERRTIADSVQTVFGLNQHETHELVALAEAEVEESVSLFQFTQLVDARFSHADKKEIVELLWRVSFADGHIDKYEEHIIRRIADLLHVSHAAFMHAKHKADPAGSP